VDVDEFVARHGLPRGFRELIAGHYAPLAAWLIDQRVPRQTMFAGIAGAQGTGKSTLAEFLRGALAADAGWRVAVLSLDDFYLTRAERGRLATRIHPLLATRGVPGTHDVGLLAACLADLRRLRAGQVMRVPRFDKARDDRADAPSWPSVTGPVDLIVLEGWCVGCPPEPAASLTWPINALERERDADGRWRRFVNDQLAGAYADLFAELGRLIFLRAPSLAAIRRWRLEQERQLRMESPADAGGRMNDAQVAEFVAYFERLTRWSCDTLPEVADVVLELDEAHRCVRSRYRR
jgi:D-glycerate 3-kinase